MTISMKTSLYGIIGKPLSHSLSPVLHNFAFSHYGIDALYLPFESEVCTDTVSAMRNLGFSGASVTIPHKIAAMAMCDELDPLARRIGAVNTLVLRPGKIYGYNTDGIGALEAMRSENIDPSEGKILIAGYGGAARAIAMTLAHEGARLIITGRNGDKMRILCDEINHEYGTRADWIMQDALTPAMTHDMRGLINTTPLGMEHHDSIISIVPELIHAHHFVFDIVYKPHLTGLIRAAREKNAVIVYGINMLLFQAMEQFTLWTGIRPEIEIFRQALAGHHDGR